MSTVLNPTAPNAREPDRAGPRRANPAVVDTFWGVSRYGRVKAFEPYAAFRDSAHAAMLGRFTQRSTTLGKQVTSPRAVYAHVVDRECVYLQSREDTLATTSRSRRAAGG